MLDKGGRKFLMAMYPLLKNKMGLTVNIVINSFTFSIETSLDRHNCRQALVRSLIGEYYVEENDAKQLSDEWVEEIYNNYKKELMLL